MKHGKRAFRRVGLVLLVMFTLGLVVVGPQVVPTYATDDLLFANTKDPVGVAAGFDPGGTKPRIYVTPCRNPRRIVFIEADGSVRRFHSLPNRSGDCARDDIEVAPGGKLEAFGDNNVYVTQGNKIYKITPDGRTRTDFATLTEAGVTCTDASSDITFDDISTPGDPNGFNNDMVATCGSRVWRINAGGAVTLVGMAVAVGVRHGWFKAIAVPIPYVSRRLAEQAAAELPQAAKLLTLDEALELQPVYQPQTLLCLRGGPNENLLVKTVERLKNTDETVEFTPLLVVDADGKAISDRAQLREVKVRAKVLGEAQGPKVDIFKYKNKTGYRRRQGHRQKYTTLEVTAIELPAQKKPTAASSEASASTKTAETAEGGDGQTTKTEED